MDAQYQTSRHCHTTHGGYYFVDITSRSFRTRSLRTEPRSLRTERGDSHLLVTVNDRGLQEISLLGTKIPLRQQWVDLHLEPDNERLVRAHPM